VRWSLKNVCFLGIMIPIVINNFLVQWYSECCEHNSTVKSTFHAYRISRHIRRTFFPEKCDLNSTCVLCAEGKIISKLINNRTAII
jgi:hypothetical protein